MKQLSIHKILITILLITSIPNLFAQKSGAKEKGNKEWFVGVNSGISVFWGDTKFNSFWPSPKMHELQAGGGFVFGRKINTALKLSSELNFTAFKGMQEILPDTLEFKTQALSFALKGQINPLALLNKKETKLALYFESGAGILAWRSLVQNHSTGDTLSNLGWTNPNKEFGFYIPAGIKIEYQISPKLSAYFSSNYNFVFSDLLDGKAIGKYDSYSFTALGLNYRLGREKVAPKLLPYNFFEIAYDDLADQSQEKEKKPKREKNIEVANPFSITFEVPETAPHTGYNIQINITKTGIPATGFFRLLIPSGFIPQAAENKNVSFTKLGYRYEYDFILPMNQDSISIPIHIKLSEIEKGTFPVLIEGEIMDQNGNIFPIKLATYTKIVSEDSWYKGLPIKEQEEFDAKKATEKQTKTSSPKYAKKINQQEETATKKAAPLDKTKSLSGTYRIQIMAGRKKFKDLTSFETQHKITEEIFISQADGWYRYTLYSTTDKTEANRLCSKVKRENQIPQAFVTYYKNGKRVILPTSKTAKGSTYTKLKSTSSTKIPKQTVSSQPHYSRQNIVSNKRFYRIEITVTYDKPIPLYLLKNKVGKESLREFEHNKNYYYTIGEFENLEVARAFLDYVKTQLKFKTAKIGQYQKNQRIKVVL